VDPCFIRCFVVIGLEQRPVVVRPPHEVADVYDDLRGVELVPARLDGDIGLGRAGAGRWEHDGGDGDGREEAGEPVHGGKSVHSRCKPDCSDLRGLTPK